MNVPARRSSLVMIELIAAILVFSICCAISVGLFVEADRESKNSDRLTKAVFLAQNAAELLNGDYEKNLTAVLGAKASGNVFTAQYNSDWQLTDGVGRYVLIISVNTQTGVAEILVTDIGAEIYRINAGLIDLNGGKFEK